MHRRRVILLFAWIASACGPVVGVGGESTSGDASTSGVGTSPSMTVASEDPTVSDEVTTVQPDPVTTMVTTVGDDTTTSSTTEPVDPSADFIIDPDGGIVDGCDLWAQDCPRGEKCMPWASDGGNSWNATRCSPIAEDPRQVGESCTVEDSAVSGIDDCVISAMCWNVDPETNMGECVGFCEGSEANPTCDDACTQCNLTGDGVLILCLPNCDPLAQDCGDGSGCYWVNDTFVCAPDASEKNGEIGSPCEFINVCDPGTYCAEANLVPGCEADYCCASFCDVEQPDTCDALLPGTACTPWYENGQQPEECLGMGTVGVCIDAE